MVKLTAIFVTLRGIPGPGPAFDVPTLFAFGGPFQTYWSDMSGKRQTLIWDVHSAIELDLTPKDRAALKPATLITAVRDSAEADGSPFAGDEHLLVVLDDATIPDTPGALGLALPDTLDVIVLAKEFDLTTAGHELGHIFQMLNHQPGTHANTFPGFQPREYTDPTCIMAGEHVPYSFKVPIAGAPAGRDDRGPAMCPPMTVVTGWLDQGNPKAVVDFTNSLPRQEQIDKWMGAPPDGYAGRPVVLLGEGFAPDGDGIYLSLRSPNSPWDRGFPGGTLVAQELLRSGATILLSRCDSLTNRSMRLGRATLRVDVLDGGEDSIVVRVWPEPWRNWTPLGSPGGQPVFRIAAVARLGMIDMFVIAQDGLVYTRSFRDSMWLEWAALPGAAFSHSAGLAVASSAPDTMDLFVVGLDDQIRHHAFANGAWGADWPIVEVGGLDQGSSLAATSNSPGQIALFASDSSGRVIHADFAAGRIGNWEPLPPLQRARALAAERLIDNQIQVHAVSDGASDERLFSIISTNGQWEGAWTSHGQISLPAEAGIAATSDTPGSAALLGADNPMFFQAFQRGHWLPSTSVDGVLLSPSGTLAVVSRAPGAFDVMAIGADDMIHYIGYSFDPNFTQANRQMRRRYRALLLHEPYFVSALILDIPFGRPRLLLWANKQVPLANEHFTIYELEDASLHGQTKTLVAVQAYNGMYVTPVDGLLEASAAEISEGQMFKMSGKWATDRSFEALDGYLWSAQNDGGSWVHCRGGPHVGPWERFAVNELP
jgi:hypothetical protein